MNPILAHHLRVARRRMALDTVAVGLPVALALGGIAWRLLGPGVAMAVMALSLPVLAAAIWRRSQRLDAAWLTAALNGASPALEDSSELLINPPEALEGLAALQRARLEARLAQTAHLDLRPAWSARWIAWSVGASLVVLMATVFWPSARDAGTGRGGAGSAAALGAPRITSVRLRITPPPYTGQRAFEQSGLDVRAPANSRIEWRLNLMPSPQAASLSFPGGSPLRLERQARRWVGARTVERSALYRIEAVGLPRQRLSRLEMIPDAAPVVRLVAPTAALTLTSPGQTRWTPVFEARDDYGVASLATVRITVTRGEGENITTTQRTLPLVGQGEARRKRFAPSLDLAREGLAEGGDMIVQLLVTDNRAPGPQTVEGPSIILRHPAAVGLAEGLDGMARQTLPVYFRSQRQIIMDAEALIAQRSRITADTFIDRSNALGADQAQLRLRYGQFMGEEAEGGGGLSLPTNDGPALDLPTNDAPAAQASAPDHKHDHGPDDGHGHGAEPSTFGQMGDVVAQFGHAHDTGDAATLFDPGTRSTLARALDAMWDSERALRQGRPKDALPHANRALELLKTAQQATRIYLARTPPRLPPVDLSRRLSGKRDGVVSGRLAPATRDRRDTPALEAWRQLGAVGRPTAPLRLDALARWVTANQARLTDPLALLAQIDTVRNEPDCGSCRQKLRALLWTALDRPPPGVLRRAPADARGRLYLDALR